MHFGGDGGGGFGHCDGGGCHTGGHVATDGGISHSGGGHHVSGDGGGFHFDSGTHTHGVPHHSDTGSFGYMPVYIENETATTRSAPRSRRPSEPRSGFLSAAAIGAGAVLAVDGWQKMGKHNQPSRDPAADTSRKWVDVAECALGVGLLAVGLSR